MTGSTWIVVGCVLLGLGCSKSSTDAPTATTLRPSFERVVYAHRSMGMGAGPKRTLTIEASGAMRATSDGKEVGTGTATAVELGRLEAEVLAFDEIAPIELESEGTQIRIEVQRAAAPPLSVELFEAGPRVPMVELLDGLERRITR